MLMLRREPGQRIIIAENIVVKFCGIDSLGRARIGIDAPPEISVFREELLGRPPRQPEKRCPSDPGVVN